MKNPRYLFISLLLAGCFLHTHAQEYFFRSYSIEQGLPQSSVFCAIEDARGELWIGTDGSGICRFNGRDVQVMDQSKGLSDNVVRAVFEDSRGIIWIGTESGLDRYDGKELVHFQDSVISASPVLAINEDSEGTLWVGTQAEGLFRITVGDSMQTEQFTISDGLANVFIFDIDIDDHDRIWLSLVGGINIIEYDPEEIHVTKLIEGYDIPSSIILCGNKDSNGDMWFGCYQEGIFKVEIGKDLDNLSVNVPKYLQFLEEERIWDIRWTGDNECFVATEAQGVVQFDSAGLVRQFKKENGLGTNQVYRITESSAGDLWFSTLGKGILKFEGRMLVTYNESSGIEENSVFEVECNERGDILVGSDEGVSVYRFENDRPLRIAAYNQNNGLTENDITAIAASENEIWVGGPGGIALIRNGKVTIPAFNKGLSSQQVNCLMLDSKGDLWIGTDNGYNHYLKGELYRWDEDDGIVNNEVQTIFEHSNGDIWLATMGGLIRLRGTEYTDFVKEDGLIELSIHALAEDAGGDLWLGTFGGGLFIFDMEYDSIPISEVKGNDLLSSKNIYSLAFLSDSVLIAATESGFDQIILSDQQEITRVIHYDVADGFPGGGNSLNALLLDDDKLWFGNTEGLVRLDPDQEPNLRKAPLTQINRLKLFFEELNWKEYGETRPWFNLPEHLRLPFRDDHLTIGFSSVYYGDHNDLSYSYFLEGQSKDWSPYMKSTEVDLPGMRPGKYTFRVKAKNKFGQVGNTESFSFEIKPPFWLQPWFILLIVVLLVAAVILYVRWRTHKLQMEKIRLEKIVDERTREVVAQKEEIERQHHIVKKQNEEIESSIHYAERIQKAVIPSEEILNENFQDSFILWRPQHIVSGDFYWIGQKDEYIVFTAADCTGHGVPGAFMSMLGVSFLNQIVLEENTVMPDEILNKLRNHIINSFSQKELEEGDRKDGMDIAMCSFNKKRGILHYAGAYNPLYLFRKNNSKAELIEHNANKMPVGLYSIMDDFKATKVDFLKGDALYLFSDGFPDQFGGEKFKKFMRKRFKEMILENFDKPFAVQKEIYNKILEEWMSFKDPDGEDIIQTDDILLIGVKL